MPVSKRRPPVCNSWVCWTRSLWESAIWRG